MSKDSVRLRQAVTDQALTGPGVSAPAARRAAAANAEVPERDRSFVDKVAREAHRITDRDVAAVKSAGATEDEIFELAVCAALGEATRQLDAALAALVAAEGTH